MSYVMRITLLFSFMLAQPLCAMAQEEVGTVVALRGQATIERGTSSIPAKVKGNILQHDKVTTAEASRIKLLFIDESVLTLAEKSKLVVSEFLYSKQEKGKSIFNLLDGKMRAIVGKTRFETQTPTAVASARGTVIHFDVGVRNGKHYTTIVCLEGTVEVRSSTPGANRIVSLTRGMSITIIEGNTIPLPTTLAPSEIKQINNEMTTQSGDIPIPGPVLSDIGTGIFSPVIIPAAPPISQVPVIKQPTGTVIIIRP